MKGKLYMINTRCCFEQHNSLVLHGEDGSDQVQGGDQDAELGYQGSQQHCPGRLTIALPVAKNLVKENTLDWNVTFLTSVSELVGHDAQQ